jgi:hypothetical protein
MTKGLVPVDFKVPEVFETDRFRLRMLTVNDVVKDYDAVMTSVKHLQETKPFGLEDTWPLQLTFEQDLIDLGWHQKEFQRRTSFAYTMINLDETECLGCMYIYPSNNPNYDAIVIMWVRQSEVANGLYEILFSNVKKWIQDKWPFKKVAYPGRETNWSEL